MQEHHGLKNDGKSRNDGMMKDPTKMKGTMDQMVNMAANDSIMFNDMIQMMKEKPEMWNKVMKMKTTTTKTNYHDA